MTATASDVSFVSLEGTPEIQEFLQRPAGHNHIVQFYEAEEALTENVGRFIAAGLEGGESIVVIATPEHRAAFCNQLRLLGNDITVQIAKSQLTLLDARGTLAQFMVGDMPDWTRFREVIGKVIESSHRVGMQRLRAYGEMVDLLWRDGNRPAAIALEEFWNDIAREYTFSLLCAYVMGNFLKSGDASQFDHVCATHTHVIPAESFASLPSPDARSRAISELQQRARALEHEIAHRKDLELALRESLAREKTLREDAERNVRFAEMFCGMLGHDLRNPLGTIAMGATYIARSNLGDKPTRTATRISTASERMARMIDQLLDFTRIRAAGGLELHRTRTDLATICERVREELEAGNPQCTITMKTAGDTCGYWDYDRLFQVFSNLVGNAVTHGSSGCEVSIEANGTNPAEVLAYVRNLGTIDAEMLPVIFDPFRGTKRHNAKGLGLGLYITRQIVLAHGGIVTAMSSTDEGTRFCVRLPRIGGSSEDSKVRV
jgi:signal transduction histidine kinase